MFTESSKKEELAWEILKLILSSHITKTKKSVVSNKSLEQITNEVINKRG